MIGTAPKDGLKTYEPPVNLQQKALNPLYKPNTVKFGVGLQEIEKKYTTDRLRRDGVARSVAQKLQNGEGGNFGFKSTKGLNAYTNTNLPGVEDIPTRLIPNPLPVVTPPKQKDLNNIKVPGPPYSTTATTRLTKPKTVAPGSGGTQLGGGP